MFRVPCPGLPGAGKWLREYLKLPLSKRIRERMAAWAPKEGMLKFRKEMAMLGAATAAVAHSGRVGSQVAVSGATERMEEAVKEVSMALRAWVSGERTRRKVVVR
jgi:hypothetical protein